MAVAVVSPCLPPYRGGTGALAWLDALSLRSLGHEVHVYAPTGPLPSAAGVVVHPLRAIARAGNAALVPGVVCARRHDLVVLHTPFFGGAEPLLLAQRLRGGRLVLAYHMDAIGAGARALLFRAHARLALPALLEAADRVLVTSLDYARTGDLARLVARAPERVITLPPAVDLARFCPGPAAPARVRLGLDPGRPTIALVARMDAAHAFKGVDVLLRALAHPALAAAQALLVGDGPERRAHARTARALGLGHRAVFCGELADDALPDAYRAADVCALPSLDRGEAFGLVALEALASGVPVVASDLPGVRTLVTDEVGVRVPPGSARALSGALSALLDDPARRARLGAAGRERAAEQHAPAVRLEGWRALLEALDCAT